ncbi:MAG: KH domain-containing protein, partial [Anaerolineaceae bacterium]|nr:KH domain-containing protein [Anaerolineaceae bacterium]
KVSKNEIAWDDFNSVARRISPNQKVRVKILDISKINEGNVSLSIKKADMAFKVIQIPSNKIGRVIGKEYRNINNVMLKTSTHIDVEDGGRFIVWYRDEMDAQNAINQINQLVKD